MNRKSKIIIYALLISILTSCYSTKPEWTILAKGDFAIGFDKYDGGLWAIDRNKQKITFYAETEKGFEKVKEAKTPIAQFEVVSLCTSRYFLWVIFTDPRISVFIELWKLNKNDLTWERKPLPEDDSFITCKSLQDGGVYILVENGELIKILDNTSVRIETGAKGIVRDIEMDIHGFLWVLTSDNGGSIYRQKENNQWELWGQYPGRRMDMVNPDTLWLAGDEVSEWDIDLPQSPRSIYSPTIVTAVRLIFSKSDGSVWFVTNTDLWTRPKNSDKFQERLKLPGFAYSFAINEDESLMFVATDKAIYYFDLSMQEEVPSPQTLLDLR